MKHIYRQKASIFIYKSEYARGVIFHTEEYTRRELNLSTSQGKKKRVFSSIVIFLSVSQKERKRNTLTFLQNGQVDLENTITLLSLMFCSIKSFTGAILLGTSGEGVLARLRLDTTKPMVENIILLAIKIFAVI